VSRHLSARDISECVIGNRSDTVEGHLNACSECAGEVARMSESIAMFGSAIREWSEQQEGNVEIKAPDPAPNHFWDMGMFRWQVATASMAALLLAAIPVHRMNHREPVPMTMTAAVSDDALLRDVETQISRSVPVSIEPLADLMTSDTGTTTTTTGRSR